MKSQILHLSAVRNLRLSSGESQGFLPPCDKYGIKSVASGYQSTLPKNDRRGFFCFCFCFLLLGHREQFSII